MTLHETLAAEVMARIERLGDISETPGVLTRRYLTPEHHRANQLVAEWMTAAGMTAACDAAGNIVGRFAGSDASAPALIIGSHLDTVVNAGKYDGMLGVLCAIACVQALNQAGRRMSFPIMVVGFADEEGVRFGTTYLGSRAMTGQLDPACLDLKDDEGVSFRQALSDFGLAPEDIGKAALRRDEVMAFLELHIEQGPVLEDLDTPAGIVTAINGQTRLLVSLQGDAGHAGTVPMGLRRDAMAAAAEAVLAVESICHGIPDAVGTVGRLQVKPGAINVIPSGVDFSVDLRAPTDQARRKVVSAVTNAIHAAAEKRHVVADITNIHEAASVPCSAPMIAALEGAMEKAGMVATRLPSGAGHDAAAMSELCDIGMIFIRCNGGISHNPAERASQDDVAVGLEIMIHFIAALEG